MIQINNLHKAFAKNKVLQGIDLDFGQSGITAVLGPNGSGKSTLIKCILGMVIPDKGTIHFDGASIKNKWNYRRQIDYLPQIARFPENLRVEELLRMIKDMRSQTAEDQELVELFELQPFMKKPLGQLSGGTRQKVNLVQAFMFDSPVIILDEPTSGLDPVAMIALRNLIQAEKEKGKIILVTTHIMSFVEDIADQLIFLLDGHIHFRGSIKQIKKQYQTSNLEGAIANILQKKNPSFSKNGKASKEIEIKL
jgi:Cu-processing system ATP-binding protein